MGEYADQAAFSSEHSWYWTWRRRSGKRGGFAIHRIASFENRGGVIRIVGYGTDWQGGRAARPRSSTCMCPMLGSPSTST